MEAVKSPVCLYVSIVLEVNVLFPRLIAINATRQSLSEAFDLPLRPSIVIYYRATRVSRVCDLRGLGRSQAVGRKGRGAGKIRKCRAEKTFLLRWGHETWT